jgi:hypothetical protein
VARANKTLKIVKGPGIKDHEVPVWNREIAADEVPMKVAFVLAD